jgi:protocatechuate 3,4-dioxygenase beta subunit
MAIQDKLLNGPVRRRDLLVGLGGLGFAALWQAACGSGGSKSATTDATGSTVATTVTGAEAASVCVLSPEVTEGPYYVANHLTRRRITDGRPGLPLALYITVVDADSCKPIENADVEIWHADASGEYSGVNGNTKHFLRGHQRSDSHGRVLFDTIYPGWYMGRAPHIHMKVHVGGAVVHTGQLFFNDSTSDAAYRTSAYKSRGAADTTNGTDNIYAAAGGSRAKVHLKRRKNHRGFRGRITVGVRA